MGQKHEAADQEAERDACWSSAHLSLFIQSKTTAIGNATHI